MDCLKARAASTTPLTPVTFLERAAIVYGDLPSIIYDTTTFTWSDTNRHCLQMASAITSLGIRPGDVVSVVAPNVPAAYELHFAVPMAGAILNTINTRLNADNISVILCHGESKMVFVYEKLQSVVLAALSMLPANHPRPILVFIGDKNEDGHKVSPDFVGTYEGLMESENGTSFDWVRPSSEWDPIVLNYTSGTTASPKGVVQSHRGAFITSIDALMDWSVPKQPVFLWTGPMFHGNGWTFTWGMAAVGGTNVCLSHFDGATIHKAIHRYNVTHMCAAPVVLNMIIDSYREDFKPLLNPVHVLTGGSPPPASVFIQAESLGFDVVHVYGLTEVGSFILSSAWKSKWNQLPAQEKAKLKARQGVRTVGVTSVDIVDLRTRKSLPRDGKSIGEIIVKGACVMLGYLKDPDATSKSITNDGWLLTGDLGVIHPDGYLEIKDRFKDIIISGAENINSIEVESVLYSFPGVSEAAVVAMPHKHWGETPCAFLSFKEGVTVKPTESEIIKFCRMKMTHYMVPTKVVFKDELPRTSTGKIQKFLLRDMAKALVLDPPSSL